MPNFLKEYWAFLRFKKKAWLKPIIIVVLLFSLVLAIDKGSDIVPLVYTMF